jgi:hypothetical protein
MVLATWWIALHLTFCTCTNVHKWSYCWSPKLKKASLQEVSTYQVQPLTPKSKQEKQWCKAWKELYSIYVHWEDKGEQASSALSSWVLMKPEFWTQGPKSWDSICQVWPCIPKCQIKRHGEGRKRRLMTWRGTCCGKRQSKHSAHPQPSSGYRHELQV